MGIWTAVVCATALGAAANPQQEKARFDFDGPTGALTLASPDGVLVEGGKSRRIQGEVSLQAQDRVGGKDATYGDTGELVARFQRQGKEVEVRLKGVGFGPLSGEAKKLAPKDGLEGGVALNVPKSHDGGPSRLKLWGTAEVLVGGKLLTDSAMVAVNASDAKKTSVAILIDGLPKDFSKSGRLDVRFEDAVVTIERDSSEPAPARPAPSEQERAAPAVAQRQGGAQATGTGGAGSAGTGNAPATQRSAQGQAAAPEQQNRPAQDGTADVAAGGTQSTTPGVNGAPGGYGDTGTSAPGPDAADGVGASAEVGTDEADGVSDTGAGFEGSDGVGTESGTGGSGSAGSGTAPLPGSTPANAPQAAASAPNPGLTPIDYSGATTGLSPVFPTNGGYGVGLGGGYGLTGAAVLDPSVTGATTSPGVNQPVGSTGVPPAAAVSPGSTTDLGVVSGSELTPGLPSTPAPLNSGRFPSTMTPGSGFTPGLPSTPPVLNDGSFPLGPTGLAPATPAIPATPGTSAPAATPVNPAAGSPANPSVGGGASNSAAAPGGAAAGAAAGGGTSR